MMNLRNDFALFAGQKLLALLEDREYESLDRNLRENQTVYRPVSRDRFALEWLGLKLALAAHFWECQCIENSVEDAPIQKIFFKNVMQCFQSPKMVSLATAFSEYYHAIEQRGDEGTSVAAVLTLCRRLGLAEGNLHGGKAGMRMLIEALEGFRASFENDFHDFLLSRLRQ